MRLYWVWLATRPGMTEKEKLTVLTRFGSAEDCYFADDARIRSIECLRESAAEALKDKSLEEAELILRICEKKCIDILTFEDAAYPAMLKNIADPPLVLYCVGTLPAFDKQPAIGVVGTRKASAYGLNTARQLGGELAGHGAIVVSGMAEGIDAMATQGALDAQCSAVGVLGCGTDRVYPRCNQKLFDEIRQHGCLISEYPPGTPPERWHFPRRNRIISGMSCGVLVVEAPQKSGALITARQALEQGRDVYVVPGNIGVATCEGSNALLREGAMAVSSGWDVLSEYACRYPETLRREIPEPQQPVDKKAVDIVLQPPYSDLENTADDLSDTERSFMAALGTQEELVDTVIARAGISSADALAALTMLEVRGYVTTRPGGWVSASKIH